MSHRGHFNLPLFVFGFNIYILTICKLQKLIDDLSLRTGTLALLRTFLSDGRKIIKINIYISSEKLQKQGFREVRVLLSTLITFTSFK